MSESLVASLIVAGILLVATNGYWWRRTERVRAALIESRERDDRIAERAATADTAWRATLQAAADRADCPPEEVPDQIASLRESLGEAHNEIERLRRSWARSYLRARQEPPADDDGPHVLTIVLPDGTTDDAQQFADETIASDERIAIIRAGGDGSVAVSVGECLRSSHDAAEIVADLMDRAGGGGGGTPAFATGGGADPDALEAAVDAVTTEIKRDLATSE